MSGLFKSKKVTPEYQSTPQDERINELWDLIQPGIQEYISKAGQGYSGKYAADLTGLEKQNLGKLQEYMDSPSATTTDEYQLARNEMKKIYGDAYDPFKSGGEYDYVRRRLSQSLNEDVLPSLRHSAAATGNLYSSGSIRDEQSAGADIMDKLASYAYGAQKDLVNLRSNNLNNLLGMADYETNESLNRINNTMSLAGIQRTQVDNPNLQGEYTDWNNIMNRLSGYLNIGSNLSGMSGGALMYPSYQPSAWQSIVLPTIKAGADTYKTIATAGAA